MPYSQIAAAIGILEALPTRSAGEALPLAVDGLTVRSFASARPRSDGPLFESLSMDQTGVEFLKELLDPREQVREDRLQSAYGVCVGDYDGDGLTDFYATSPVDGNRLYKNLGNFRFRDVTVEAGVNLRT
jgi:hypothetical protein